MPTASAAGVRRTPAPDTVGLHRPSDPKNAALAKRVQTYLTRMGMPDRLFKEMMQRASDKTLVLVTCYPFYYIGPAPKRFIVEAVKN